MRYRAFDLLEAGPARIEEMLRKLVELVRARRAEDAAGALVGPASGVGCVPALRESRHIGKIVLSVPQPFDPGGTVLITGGTGGLGALLARHLAGDHGAGGFCSSVAAVRRPMARVELREELAELGCDAQVVACDVSDRAELQSLLDAIPAEQPLTMVVHAAGVLDDGLIESMDRERLARVLAPKVDAAINLHELTENSGLREFVLFSSLASSMGGPGQSNYAAANAFLDAWPRVSPREGPAGRLAGMERLGPGGGHDGYAQ